MALATIIIGGILLVGGLLGQMFGTRHLSPTSKADRRASKVIATVGSVVIACWIVAFVVAHVMHMHMLVLGGR